MRLVILLKNILFSFETPVEVFVQWRTALLFAHFLTTHILRMAHCKRACLYLETGRPVQRPIVREKALQFLSKLIELQKKKTAGLRWA